MRSTFSGLNTLVRGIYAQQIGLETVGHNISNANTEGYSRQSANLVTSRPETLYGSRGFFQLGTGVEVQSVTRARDAFIDQQMWKEKSSLGYGETVTDMLGKVEGVFREPTPTGIQTVLNKFWSALQTVAADASDLGARTALRQRGVELVDSVKHAETQLSDMVSDMNDVLDIKVNKINQIGSEILSLNKQICSIETGGDHANDLRDRRDVLVDQLSQLTKVSVYEDRTGNYIVQMPGVTLVDSQNYVKLKTSVDTNSAIFKKYGFEVRNVVIDDKLETPVQFSGGEIKGLLAARDDEVFGVKGYLDKLDTISKFLLKDFNRVHKQGYGLDNSTGTNFFGVQGVNYDDPAQQPKDNTASGSWLKELQVNRVLFDSLSGLNKIAAKTLDGNITISQSNTEGGKASLSDINYVSQQNLKFSVRIKEVDALGKVTSAQYLDNTGAWVDVAAGDVDATGADTVITLHGAEGSSVKIKIETHAKNRNYAAASAGPPATAEITDTYTFYLQQGNAAGDNAVRMAEALKYDVKSASVLNDPTYDATFGNASLDNFYNSMTGALGVQTQDAKRLTENQTVLVNQIRNWREAVSGVNMDEEMTNMIRLQKGYNAAARVLTTMDEMLDKLINGTGVVGR